MSSSPKVAPRMEIAQGATEGGNSASPCVQSDSRNATPESRCVGDSAATCCGGAIDVQELLNLPSEFVQTFSRARLCDESFKYPWWRKGDIDAFFALWADNLATQLGLLAVLNFLPGWPSSFAYSHFMPGVGVSLLLGNTFYALQASKVATRSRNVETCAQPYGINTPGAFAKTFAIIIPVYMTVFSRHGSGEIAAFTAWRVACACNFVSGLMEFLGAFVAPLLTKAISPVVLLTPLTGIALSWLFLNPFVDMLGHDPIVGLLPFCVIWMAMFSKVSFGRVPAGLVSIALGTALGWSTGMRVRADVIAGVDHLGMQSWTVGDCFYSLDEVGAYISLLLPVALTSALGTLQCVCSANEAGDNYSPMETMLVDGVGTMVGALFGSPYGTTVYIGHPAYKALGASRGYSLLNGLVYVVMGATGLHGLLNALIPHEAVLGVICFVGLSIATQTVSLCPPRWYPALFLGAIVAFSDWSITTLAPGKGGAGSAAGFVKEGYLFTSFLYTWAFTAMTDRRFLRSAQVWALAAAMAAIGLLHSAKIDTWDKSGTIRGSGGRDGMPGWRFLAAYLGMAVLNVVAHLLQKHGHVDAPISEDAPRSGAKEPAIGDEAAFELRAYQEAA
mmetsp:Transcript_121347/g.343382  ORF Transcript_121347/g.343382 Transcript_121347/m.343382 type:complete len:617 (+) Transcript_121347:79-1929(+)